MMYVCKNCGEHITDSMLPCPGCCVDPVIAVPWYTYEINRLAAQINLVCRECGADVNAQSPHGYCPECGKPLPGILKEEYHMQQYAAVIAEQNQLLKAAAQTLALQDTKSAKQTLAQIRAYLGEEALDNKRSHDTI